MLPRVIRLTIHTMNTHALRVPLFTAAILFAAVFAALVAVSIVQAAPVISEVDTEASDTSATIRWDTDTESNTQVHFGETTDYGTYSAIEDTDLTNEHEITLFGLEPDTDYNFQIITSDEEGTTTSQNYTFRTDDDEDNGDDENAPEISSIEVVDIGETEATVEWATDEPATGQVQYGTDEDDLSSSLSLRSLSVASTSHSITLFGLEPDTTYFYRVVATDEDDNIATSSVDEFTTLDDDNGESTLDELIDELEFLKDLFPGFADEIQDFIDELLGDDDDNGNGDGDGNGEDDAYIEQDGRTVTSGQHVDFGGHKFGSEELVRVERDGTFLQNAFTNQAGSFTTGSIPSPTEDGSYTYTFEGQETGIEASAIITVE